MVTILNRPPPRKSTANQLISGFGGGLNAAAQLIGKKEEKEELMRQEAQKAKLEQEKAREKLEHDYKLKEYEYDRRKEIEELKGQGKKSVQEEKLEKNKAILRELEKQYGLEEGQLKAFEDNPQMAASVFKPSKEPRKRLEEQPVDPEQKKAIEAARNVPGYNDMDEVDQYRTLLDHGVSPKLAETESKLTSTKLERKQKGVESSYNAQKDFINETTDKHRAFETDTKPKLLQMQKVASDDTLISPTAAVFLDAMGIPLGALEDPSSELYNKLSLDLLKGLPDTYGNRILKVEVDNFLKTIPSLLNSPNGRRMIASNMLKLGEMKEVYYNAMRQKQREYLDSDQPLPRDFQQLVFDQVKPQIDRINEEFVKMSNIKSIPNNTIPFFSPNGQIQFVPKDKADWAQENGGRRIW